MTINKFIMILALNGLVLSPISYAKDSTDSIILSYAKDAPGRIISPAKEAAMNRANTKSRVRTYSNHKSAVKPNSMEYSKKTHEQRQKRLLKEKK